MRLKIESNPHGFFVSRRKSKVDLPGGERYLHSDGKWRTSTQNEATGEFTGYFRTYKLAVAAFAATVRQ